MKAVHFYLSLFPTEALIASHLAPEAFAVYMATGTRRDSSEPLTFIELTGDLSAAVDLAFVQEELATLPEARIKHSLYLSVYRSLELTPMENLGALYLVTQDGRSLRLEALPPPETAPPGPNFLYQELCPVRPLVVSKLAPVDFCRHMTHPNVKIHLPKLAMVHQRVVDLHKWSHEGYYGGHYLATATHVQCCFSALEQRADKLTKVIGRSRLQTFNYGLIESGVYVADASHVLFYPMPDRDTLNESHYAWGKSAHIF